MVSRGSAFPPARKQPGRRLRRAWMGLSLAGSQRHKQASSVRSAPLTGQLRFSSSSSPLPFRRRGRGFGGRGVVSTGGVEPRAAPGTPLGGRGSFSSAEREEKEGTPTRRLREGERRAALRPARASLRGQ
ncbi:Hypothetical predicted protein [Podarcis lilfordi]|uniref:Uncharacterized protein n=1 Tax=Podarcis lilfordi TaxID=74358 RepID=A0AA35PP83_9SAUR|nr:Hypothetical predicted protein [Podarcis lilfordi]